MVLLDSEMRAVLREVGPPGEHVSDATFLAAMARGWGYWKRDAHGYTYWHVTEAGRGALERDNAARAALGAP